MPLTPFLFLISLIIICIAGIFALWRRKTIEYWHGPDQTKEQQKETSRFVTDHLISYPDSPILSKEYPQEYKKAQAIRRYNELERMRNTGKIDDIDYQRELEKILPLIDITDALEK